MSNDHPTDVAPSAPSPSVVPEIQQLPVLASWLEQDGVLRDMWMQNKTPQQISEVLGRSVPAIMTRAARLGLPRRSAPGRKPGSGGTRRFAALDGRKEDPDDQTLTEGHSAHEKEKTPSAASQATLRICLMCLRKFESAGRHNRICSPCKGSAEYIQASALPEIQLPQT